MLVLGPGPKRGRGVGGEGINEALGRGKVTMKLWERGGSVTPISSLFKP